MAYTMIGGKKQPLEQRGPTNDDWGYMEERVWGDNPSTLQWVPVDRKDIKGLEPENSTSTFANLKDNVGLTPNNYLTFNPATGVTSSLDGKLHLVFDKDKDGNMIGFHVNPDGSRGTQISPEDAAAVSRMQYVQYQPDSVQYDPIEQMFADLAGAMSGFGIGSSISFGSGGGGSPSAAAGATGGYDDIQDVTSYLKTLGQSTLSQARFEGSEEGYDRAEGLARANVESANKSAQQQAAARLGEIGMSPERIADMQRSMQFDSVKNTVGGLAMARAQQDGKVLGLRQQGFTQMGQLGELRNSTQQIRNNYDVGMSNAAAAHSQAAASMANAQSNALGARVNAIKGLSDYKLGLKDKEIQQQGQNSTSHLQNTQAAEVLHKIDGGDVVVKGGSTGNAAAGFGAGLNWANVWKPSGSTGASSTGDTSGTPPPPPPRVPGTGLDTTGITFPK